MKTKRLSVFVGIVAMMMAMAMSFTGCNDNNDNEDVGEYLQYAWYIRPDTTRGEDGKLYFHYLRIDTNDGFVDSITGIRFDKESSFLHSDYEEYVSRAYKSWGLWFDLTGKYIRPSNNFPLFREYCIKYGVRPLQRTPYDAELQKVMPCGDWTVNDVDLCCEQISDIQVITRRDFDAAHPAGSDISDIMRISASYLDDYVAWYKTNYTDYPKFSGWYWLKDPDTPVPFVVKLEMPVREYVKAPRSMVLTGYGSEIGLGCSVIPQVPGDYPFTITVTMSSGRKVTAEVKIKVV